MTEYQLPNAPVNGSAESRRILYVGKGEPCLSAYLQQHNFLSISISSVSKAQVWLERMATAQNWAQRMGKEFHDLPDAILCEQYLPDGDAFLLHHFLWANEHLRFVPFILLVEEVKEAVSRAALSARMDDCYPRNASPEKICNRILFLQRYKKETMRISTEQPNPPVFKVPLWKRSFDIMVSLALLWVLSPLMLLIALLVKLETRGPVFYISRRAGTGYRIFDFFKFRSMRVGADQELQNILHLNQYTGEPSRLTVNPFQRCVDCMLEDRPCEVPLERDGKTICAIRQEQEQTQQRARNTEFVKIKNDPRVTRVGRILRQTSLDELPQLFNVLIGDMSIVGNRPLPVYEAERLTVDFWAKRFLAPAGITGLWQVKWRNRSGMSPEERKALDAHYAEHASFWLDMRILLRTFPALFRSEAE